MSAQTCDRCGHRWALHEGCCTWRDGDDFCLCIVEEPICAECDERVSDCCCEAVDAASCDSPYHPGCARCAVTP